MDRSKLNEADAVVFHLFPSDWEVTLKEHQLFLTICDFSKVSDIAKALESMEN